MTRRQQDADDARPSNDPGGDSCVMIDNRVFRRDRLAADLRADCGDAGAALVAQLRRDRANGYRNQDAFEVLLAAFGPGVRRYVHRRLRDDQERAAAYLEVFARVARDIDRFDPDRAPLRAWILGLARSAVLNEYEPHRKRLRQEEARRQRDDGTPARHPVGVDVDRVVDALGRLSPRKQRIIFARAVMETSFAEMAAAENRGEAGVQRMYNRALLEVEAIYRDADDDPPRAHIPAPNPPRNP